MLPVYSVFFMILTLASIGLPTTSGFTGEFLVLLGAFTRRWPQHLAGDAYPLLRQRHRRRGRRAGRAVHAAVRAALPVRRGRRRRTSRFADLDCARSAILAAIVAAVFALGLFPDEPMRKTELAARQYQQLVSTPRSGAVARSRAARR